MSTVSRGWRADLFGCSMLPFLFLSLSLQLVLHVLDVPSKAVAVEVVVTGCFGEGFILLEGAHMWGTASELSHQPSTAHPKQTPSPRDTHLETIEADDTLAVRDVVICENLLPFLRGEKTLFKQGGGSKTCEQNLPTIPRSGRTVSRQARLLSHVHTFLSW